MGCRQWSPFTGVSASGLCSFEMLPETANKTQSCEICLTPMENQRVATLRAFNVDNGQLLWEKINFTTIGKSPSGAVYGYRWRNVTLGKEYEYIQNWYIPVNPYAALFNSESQFQTKTTSTFDRSGQTWAGDCVKVDIYGAETLVMQDALRKFVPGGSSAGNPSISDLYSTYTSGEFYALGADDRPQLYRCSDDHLFIGDRYDGGFNQYMVEMTDMQKRVKKHTLRIRQDLAFAMSSNIPKWVVKCGNTVAKFGLYATAEEVQTSLLTLEGVVAVNAVGGPLCKQIMDIDIEFDTVDRTFSHFCIEWASQDLPAASTVGVMNNSKIFSLATHAHFVPLTLRTLQIDYTVIPSFTSLGTGETGIIASGNWGPLHIPGPFGFPKRALSLLKWTDNPTVPNWGTINQKVWEQVPFDRMIQTQEWLSTGNEDGRGWGVSAIRYGKVAVTARSQREPVLSGSVPWNTHIIYDEGSGQTDGYEYSGFLNGTRILFGDGDNQFRGGSRHGFTQSGSRGYYAEPDYVESYGTASFNEAGMRESDFGGGLGNLTFAVGTKQVVAGYGHSIYIAQQWRTAIQYDSHPADRANYILRTPWITTTTGSIPAQAQYPWGSFRRDSFFMTSLFTRFSAGTEWQLLHGSIAGGTFYPHKQTSWFSLYVSLDTVKDELEAWYGSISGGGNPIVYVNPFGGLLNREEASPPLPTFQRINEIWVYRDSNVPNPFSPLAPRFADAMSLKLRNMSKIITHPLMGLNPETGEIVWQRDVGIDPAGEDVAFGFGLVSFANNIVTVTTRCKAGVDTPIFPRGT